MRYTATSILIVALIIVAMMAFGGDPPPPRANTSPPDFSTMRVLGSVRLPGGADIDAVYAPTWPLSTVCLIVTSPHGIAIRCDGDTPTDER